jgi:hypothetical protein
MILLLTVTSLFSLVYLGLNHILAAGVSFVFLAGFVFWRLRVWRQSNVGVPSHEILRVTESGIDWVGCPSPLVLQGVIRHWAGITLLCQSKRKHRLVSQRVTLWQDQFEPEQYRRLNVLLNWLTRGQA